MIKTSSTIAIAIVLAAGATICAAGLAYTAPAGWKTIPTKSEMRVAQFTLPRAAGDSEDGELVVYYFGGSGGSVEANIERWIGQMEQPGGRSSSAVAKREKRTLNGLAFSLVDVSGTYTAEMMPGSQQRHNNSNYRLRAAVVETPNGPYFIKLTGPAQTIAAHESAFDQFLASVKYQK
jgi:hypothetical protein